MTQQEMFGRAVWLGAKECKNTERNPVVESLDEVVKIVGCQPPDKRVKGLEETEKERHGEH